METKIFVSLPVKDLEKSKVFFSKLGFSFDPGYSDEKAACMIVSSSIYVMLLKDDFFKTFTKKEIPDTSKESETIITISVDTKELVDDMINKALAAGGSKSQDKMEMDTMYAWSFQDIDSHMWEVMYIEPTDVDH
jgi:uncharacterized protein